MAYHPEEKADKADKKDKKKKELTTLQKIGKAGEGAQAMSKSMKKARKANADRVAAIVKKNPLGRTVKRIKPTKMGRFGGKSAFR